MKPAIPAALREVEAALGPLAAQQSAERIAFLRHYVGTQLDVLAIPVPAQRKIARAGFSFSHLDPPQQMALWDGIWQRAGTLEVLAQALFYAASLRDPAALALHWPVLRGWVDRIDNWALSDGLSDIYARILDQERGLVLPTLQAWNADAAPWRRRQSVVALLYYARGRTNPLPARTILAQVKPLLGDPDVFVQKGVGWCLRETGNLYPAAALAFLEAHLHRLSAAAFAAATEKVAPAIKARLKGARAAGRRQR